MTIVEKAEKLYGIETSRDDWSWMVDEDPAFYLEDREAAR